MSLSGSPWLYGFMMYKAIRRLSLEDVGLYGACAYVASIGIPCRWDIGLLALCLSAVVLLFIRRDLKASAGLSSVSIGVYYFTAVTALFLLFDNNINNTLLLYVPFVPGLLIYFLVSSTIRRAISIQLFLASLVTGGIVLALSGIATSVVSQGGGPTQWAMENGSHVIVAPNDFAFVAILTPVCFALFDATKSRITKLGMYLSFVVILAVITVYQSRLSVLTTAASVICYFAISKARATALMWLAPFIAILSVIVLVDACYGFPLLEKFQHIAGTRIAIWRVAWEAFLNSPLYGQGTHSFASIYVKYYPSAGALSWGPVDPRTMPWAHNLYLETLAEQGLVGLSAVVLLFASGLWQSWRSQSISSGVTRFYNAGAFSALAGACFAAAFELSFIRLGAIVVVFSLIGTINALSIMSQNTGESR